MCDTIISVGNNQSFTSEGGNRMTKKHFKAIAEIIKESYNPAYDMFAGKEFVNKITDYLATQNPHFDREKFLNACGIK
jgi:hypothetical protein